MMNTKQAQALATRLSGINPDQFGQLQVANYCHAAAGLVGVDKVSQATLAYAGWFLKAAAYERGITEADAGARYALAAHCFDLSVKTIA